MSSQYPHSVLPEPPSSQRVKSPPGLSQLLPEERARMSEKELLEAGSEEDEGLAFLLEYRELLDNLEKQRQHLLESDRPPLLGREFFTSSTRANRRR
jgi:hypothetical protein